MKNTVSHLRDTAGKTLAELRRAAVELEKTFTPGVGSGMKVTARLRLEDEENRPARWELSVDDIRVILAAHATSDDAAAIAPADTRQFADDIDSIIAGDYDQSLTDALVASTTSAVPVRVRAWPGAVYLEVSSYHPPANIVELLDDAALTAVTAGALVDEFMELVGDTIRDDGSSTNPEYYRGVFELLSYTIAEPTDCLEAEDVLARAIVAHPNWPGPKDPETAKPRGVCE